MHGSYMADQRVTERPSYIRRVVFAEDPRIAQALEQRAIEHGRSVAAEVRAAVREHLRWEEHTA
jgi:plasmid stability protein